jgi:hypothetical protein
MIAISVIRSRMGLTQTLAIVATQQPFDLERATAALSIRTTVWATVILTVLVIAGALIRNRVPRLKLPIFILIATTVITTTGVLAASTVYLNTHSSSGGPVHWHADFEMWVCGEQIDLVNPHGWLSNKVGTASLHEHNDKRIHLEGVVVEPRDASLGKFFSVVGGMIDDDRLVLPTNDRTLILADGDRCPDGTLADVQTYAYTVNGLGPGGKRAYSQRKLDNPEDYIIAPESQVPPGDCIIVEVGPTRERTDKRCLQYQVQDDELGNYEEVQ